MRTPLTSLLLAALLLPVSLPLPGLAQALAECRSWREQRDRLASEAMQAEIALVQATRRRLCPRLEALAEQANAIRSSAAGAEGEPGREATDQRVQPGGGEQQQQPAPIATGQQAPEAAAPGDSATEAAPQDFDYTAYLQCRRQAEVQLRRSRTILYTNQKGFTFYTATGARLAREADGWQQRWADGCQAKGGG